MGRLKATEAAKRLGTCPFNKEETCKAFQLRVLVHGYYMCNRCESSVKTLKATVLNKGQPDPENLYRFLPVIEAWLRWLKEKEVNKVVSSSSLHS